MSIWCAIIPSQRSQGANLTSNLMAALCKQLGTTQTRTSAYHLQGNGQVERFNRTLESMLAEVVTDHQTDWDTHLPQVGLGYSSLSLLIEHPFTTQ